VEVGDRDLRHLRAGLTIANTDHAGVDSAGN
jgi:hypothetical protein